MQTDSAESHGMDMEPECCSRRREPYAVVALKEKILVASTQDCEREGSGANVAIYVSNNLGWHLPRTEICRLKLEASQAVLSYNTSGSHGVQARVPKLSRWKEHAERGRIGR